MSDTAVQIYEGQDLAISRQPGEVLGEAQRAAKALTDVLSKKKKPVIFNNEQYLEFEDWHTVGRFYGVPTRPSRFSPDLEVRRTTRRCREIRNNCSKG